MGEQLGELLQRTGVRRVFGGALGSLPQVPVGDRPLGELLAARPTAGSTTWAPGARPTTCCSHRRPGIEAEGHPAAYEHRGPGPDAGRSVAGGRPGRRPRLDLDLDLDAPIPDGSEAAPSAVAAPSASARPGRGSGDRARRSGRGPGRRCLDAQGLCHGDRLGVVNTWGPGVFRWDSLPPGYRRAPRAETALAGLEAQFVVAVGVDPAEAPPARLEGPEIVDLHPFNLADAADGGPSLRARRGHRRCLHRLWP